MCSQLTGRGISNRGTLYRHDLLEDIRDLKASFREPMFPPNWGDRNYGKW